MPTGYQANVVVRAATVALLVVGIVAVIAIVMRGGRGGPYILKAQFRDAGQLVSGDEVQLGGHRIGSVNGISITPNGLAEVRLKITDASLTPLHLGTTATIGSPGLSGVANRYVRLDPGPGEAVSIPDGGVLAPEQTRGIVDLDTLLDGLDAPTRKRIQVILREGADLFAAPAGRQSNVALALLNPALSRTTALGGELVRDQAALVTLIGSTADVASTLAARRPDLARSISNTATVLREVGARRAELSDLLARTPAVLRQADGVLTRTRTTLRAVDPVLRHLQPVAQPAAHLLREFLPVARNTTPAIAAVRRLLPRARATLALFPDIAKTTIPALQSTVDAANGLAPIIRALRPYGPDLLAGFFEGFGGNSSGYYDANGHYARIHLNLGPGTASVGSLGAQGAIPGLLGAIGSGDIAGAVSAAAAGASGQGAGAGYLTGLTARCPGGASQPAPDGSNPFIPADFKDLCNPADDPQP